MLTHSYIILCFRILQELQVKLEKVEDQLNTVLDQIAWGEKVRSPVGVGAEDTEGQDARLSLRRKSARTRKSNSQL